MSRPKAPATKGWAKTLAFKHFNDQHKVLSRLYWTAQAGRDLLAAKLHKEPADAAVTDGMPLTFAAKRLPERVGEFKNLLPQRAGIERLHLLVICSANLEAYLRAAIELHVGCQPSRRNASGLNRLGKSEVRCVRETTSVSKMLLGIETLLGVSFSDLDYWRRGYKLRCAAAHDGGIVTPRTLSDLPGLGLAVGDRITLGWEELNDQWVCAWEIAARVDSRVSRPDSLRFEILALLRDWHREGSMPAGTQLWAQLHALGVTVATGDRAALLRDATGGGRHA